MRILVVHNEYRFKGGEDTVVEAEVALLSAGGHDVIQFTKNNHSIGTQGKLSLLFGTMWSGASSAQLQRLIAEFRPDVIHAHNTFPQISPSIYWTASKAGIPVVQTLHNFRLLCTQAMFLRDGKICEACLGRLPWRGVVHACYRDSRAQSAAALGMVTLHRAIGTYAHKVSRYIALNEFCRRKFIEGGIPGDKISVKPNFVDFPPVENRQREGFLFVGRLSTEKGIQTLIDAAALGDTPITVVGDGPLSGLLAGARNIQAVGKESLDQIMARMYGAAALIVPSIWYENFPRTIVEAYACGLPVIASNIGALPEIVEDGRTGLLFEPGDAADLASKIAWARANPSGMKVMSDLSRSRYEQSYTPQKNLKALEAVYGLAMGLAMRSPA